MFKLVLHLLLVRFTLPSDSGDILEALNLQPDLRQKDKIYDENCFPELDLYQLNSSKVKETKHPWIAQLVHSRAINKENIPHMCTVICIDEAIYITAARCIYSLKILYTTIVHMSRKFEARAFVFPSKPTLQMFDDIGFIVVDKNKVKGVSWKTIPLVNLRRSDPDFRWISKLDTSKNSQYKAVGYALTKGTHRERRPARKFELYDLDVIVQHDLCHNILEQFRKGNGYKVPCYHSCTFPEYLKRAKKCDKFLGVEGGALILTSKPNTLVGVATWGVWAPHNIELPVGFSVVNSENFFKDWSCAKLIRGDKGGNVKENHYQKLCDSKQ